MAENEETVKQDKIAVGGYTEFDDDDAALEALVQLKELTFGETFDERDTTIDSDDSEGISIIFYHTEQGNELRVHTTEDDHVHITCKLVDDHIRDTQDILETVADEVGEITIGQTITIRYIEVAFDSLDFPIQDDTEHNVTGIRITDPEANYITQTEDEHGMLFVSRDRRFDEDGKLTDVEPLGVSDWEAINKFIDEFA